MPTRASKLWSPAAVATAALVLTACSGAAGHPAASSAGIRSSTTTKVAAPKSPTTAAAQRSVTATTAQSSTAASPTSSTTTAGTGSAGQTTTAPARVGSASTSSSVGAAPGHYVYDVTGERSGGTSPGTQAVNAKADLTIDPASGSDQTSTVSSSQSGGQTQTTDYRYLPNGILLVDTTSGGKEFKPDPPVLAMPVPPTVGTTWSWTMTSTDKSTTVRADNKITGTAILTIGGQPVQTVVLVVTLTTNTSYGGAPLTLKTTETNWLSPKYNLIVKRHDVTDVSPYAFHSDTTQTLESIKPA